MVKIILLNLDSNQSLGGVLDLVVAGGGDCLNFNKDLCNDAFY